MTKKQGGHEFPQEIGKELSDDHILVTQENRAQYLVHGRLCYMIKFFGNKYVLLNIFDIRPRHIKGHRTIYGDSLKPEGYTIWIMEEESLEEYQDAFRTIVGKSIETKTLYVKKTDQPLQYKHEK